MHVIAAKAVAFGEALQPDFKAYATRSRRQRPGAGRDAGRRRLGDRHRRHRHPPDAGRSAAARTSPATRPRQALERASITCNKNGIPFDPEKPIVTSGIRLGSPAATTRGFGVAEFREIGDMDRRGARRPARSARTAMPPSRRGCAARSERCANASRSIAGWSKGSWRSRWAPARKTEDGDALSLLRHGRHPGEGYAPDRGSRRDPAAAHLPELRRPLHHLRARPVARADRGQEERPARAVRSRQAGALGRDRAAQARRSSPSGSSAWSTRHRAPARKLGRDRHPQRHDRRAGHGGAASLDHVAYVRFASVYRNFREAKDFGEFVGRIAADGDC